MHSLASKILLSIAILMAIFILFLIFRVIPIDVENVIIERANIPLAFNGFKIVQVSDLHVRTSTDKKAVIEAVKSVSPDIILITGDLVDHPNEIEGSPLGSICRSFADICDVYAVTGNHEFGTNDISLWKNTLEKNGVKIIDNDIVIIEKDGERLALMGLRDNTPYSCDIFPDIDKTVGAYKILLAHRPELWKSYSSKSHAIRPDLVLSGHAHGGIVQIPKVGALYSPNQGFFPKYTYGLYSFESGTEMYVSRGLDDEKFPPRINNNMHLPVFTLYNTQQ